MKIILSDFDGTLTDHGSLGAVFFDLISHLKKNNLELIIVSGRSLSWGHFLLTHFPLNYVLMEGGGVLCFKDEKGFLKEECLVSNEDLEKLKDLKKRIQNNFKDVVFSLDSFGRKTDFAIEFNEMREESYEKLLEFLKTTDAHFSRSNVHLNIWYGEHTKYSSSKYVVEKKLGQNVGDALYFGDSLNDESMFQNLKHTVGVSNIDSVLNKLTYKPSVVLTGEKNREIHGVLNYLKEKLI